MEFDVVVKDVEVAGHKFTLYEPAGFEVDEFLMKYYDDSMNPIHEKLPEANVALIKMCFHMSEEEVKRLPSSVYYTLLNTAAEYFRGLSIAAGGDEEKK